MNVRRERMRAKSLIFSFIFLMTLAVFLGEAIAAKGWVVIVNKANPITEASKDEVAKWFLKKKTTWENGQKILPVDQSPSSPVRKAFSKEVLGKSVSAVRRYWQKMIFSGRGVPPVEKGSDAEVIDYVRSNPGAVGYVSSNADVSGVKVLKIK